MAWSSSDSASRIDPCAARAISASAAGSDAHVLRREDRRQHVDDQRRRQLLQVELQAARQHGDGNLLRIGRRQHELDVLRRLLERLQHRIERGLRQHVHFVDQVDLEAPDGRHVARVVEDLAHVVDAGVRRGVELEQIDEAAGVDVDARGAGAARRRGDAVGDAVEALGEDPRDRRLADAARAGEQVGVMQAVARERIGQRRDHVLLPDELAERLRPPLAGEYLVAHPGPGVRRRASQGERSPGVLPSYRSSGEARVGENASMYMERT